MSIMPILGAAAMPMTWMPMCGQSWLGAAASFLGMWTLMMAAMMLPSLLPVLWRYRRSTGRAGRGSATLVTVPVAGGYLLAWSLLGAALYPLGTAAMALLARLPAPGSVLSVGAGLTVALAGVLQLSSWKASELACCRTQGYRELTQCGCVTPLDAMTAWRDGLRAGLHCIRCCAGVTAALLVTGLMNGPVMLAAAVAINLERLAPAGERIARVVGVAMIGAGVLLTANALGLH